MVFWSRKMYRRAVQMIGGNFYINPDPAIRKSIIVAGTARSGTTWLGDLIASQIRCRILFEPYNPILVPEYGAFSYFQYMRAGEDDQDLYNFSHRILTGKIRNRWIDRQNERLFADYRLIKEIRANLLLEWLLEKFPETPIVFLMRHPCAVVLSRMELGWATDRDIEPFLSQPKLINDFLQNHMPLIQNAATDAEKHAIIWCISHLVPYKQNISRKMKVVFYEDLCVQPEIELTAISEFLGHNAKKNMAARLDRPSQTTKATSAVVTGENRITQWKKKLDTVQIQDILTIVNAFGLGHIYNEQMMPISRTI